MKNDLVIPTSPGLPTPEQPEKVIENELFRNPSGSSAPSPKERSYILYYRYSKIPSLFKVFNHRGTLQDAVIRGRKHCLTMGYIFILVLPFMVDLEDQEKRKSQDPQTFEDDSALSMRL